MAILKKEQDVSSSTYPLDLDGPLCPLLDDGELLLRFYEESGAKLDIKKYVKRHRWEGKPPLSYSVGRETLKKMILSLQHSARARRELHSTTHKNDNALVLYQVIWNWLSVQDPKLIEAIDKHSHSVGDRIYVTPAELDALIETRQKEEDWEEKGKLHLAFLVLAFTMLQPDDRSDLVRTFTRAVPELAAPMGVE